MLKNLEVPVTPLHTGHVAVDADATPYDNSRTKKEHAGRTYQGFDGYNPMKVYLGEEGWCITAELRTNTFNGQNEFLYKYLSKTNPVYPPRLPPLEKGD